MLQQPSDGTDAKPNCVTDLKTGQRWLRLTDRFGQLSVGLITKNWMIDDKQVTANDTVYVTPPKEQFN